ncbi:MAG: hypothetical protein LBV55_04165, partial [Acholeplasmatales bacterium]|nr:hypothetical protein [Acholeplasmatales bacterium]
MKKLFILLFIIFSSILLVGCNDQDDYAHTIPPFTKFTHKANSFLDMASYVAFGKLKIYYDLWEFGVPGIDYHGVENPETIFLQATQ